MTKILVVEDSKNISYMIYKCLKDSGFDVETASDGVEAMIKAFEVIPDLILLDILIPKLNGYAVFNTIKSNDKNVPIIAMSAKTQEKDIKMALDLGFNDYLKKPFTPSELLEVVKMHLSYD